jgi:hypothetical protein
MEALTEVVASYDSFAFLMDKEKFPGALLNSTP